MFTAAAAVLVAVSVALECDVMAAFVLVHNAWLALQCKHSVLLLVVGSFVGALCCRRETRVICASGS